MKHRNEHLDEINKKSSYKFIQVRDKNDNNNNYKPDFNEGVPGSADSAPINVSAGGETDLNSILKKRIEAIQEEMSKFNTNINDFAETCDSELNNLIGNINLLQRNLGFLNAQ